jgi:hypothetical protein
MGLLIPNASQSLSLVKKYLPGSLLIGGATAGLQHVATMLQEMKKDEKDNLERQDVLTVPVPISKEANLSPLMLKAIQAGVISPETAKRVTQAVPQAVVGSAPATSAARLANLQARMGMKAPPSPAAPPVAPPPAGGAPSAPSPAAGGAGAPPPPSSTTPSPAGGASPVPSPTPVGSAQAAPSKIMQMIKNHPVATSLVGSLGAAGAGSAIYNKATGEQPPSVMDAGIIAATVPLGILGGYGLVNHFIRERKKKNLEEQLQQAKDEYAGLLGGALAKTASVETAEFPLIDGVCIGLLEAKTGDNQKFATNAALLLAGAPVAAAALSGIIAHRWMYNKQKEVEGMYASEKPKPPKQIRLVSVPPQPKDEDEESPLAIGLQSEKVAEVPSTIADSVVSLLGNSPPVSAEEALQKQLEEERKNQASQPKVVKVGPGVTQITSHDGPVEVQAEDPATAKILSAGAPRLAKLIGMFQSTDATLR